jgi:hypothetical protein
VINLTVDLNLVPTQMVIPESEQSGDGHYHDMGRQGLPLFEKRRRVFGRIVTELV